MSEMRSHPGGAVLPHSAGFLLDDTALGSGCLESGQAKSRDSHLEAACWSLGHAYLLPPSLTPKAFILSLTHKNPLFTFMLFSGTPVLSSSGPVQRMSLTQHEAAGATNSPLSPGFAFSQLAVCDPALALAPPCPTLY